MIPKLPIHGFVLAGGLSSRMREDKAMLHFRGRPMVEIAVERLGYTCELVSIAGNRSDLAKYGRVIPDRRVEGGPAAGIEAGLLACQSEWAMFSPVDLPLLPATFVHSWAESVLSRQGTRASYPAIGSAVHPALCLLRKDCSREVVSSVRGGNRRLQSLLGSIEGLWIADVRELTGNANPSAWLMNVNTPQDLRDAEKREIEL